MSSPAIAGANRFLLMGIAVFGLGVVCIASPAVAGTAVVYVIGSLMLLAAIVQIVQAWRAEGWSGKVVPLILGAITGVAGAAVLAHPLLGLEMLTLVVAAYFLVEGLWKFVASFSYRPARGWLAILLSGLLALILGALIFAQWPLTGLFAVGILVGINLLSTGASLICLSVTIRTFNKRLQQAQSA